MVEADSATPALASSKTLTPLKEANPADCAKTKDEAQGNILPMADATSAERLGRRLLNGSATSDALQPVTRHWGGQVGSVDMTPSKTKVHLPKWPPALVGQPDNLHVQQKGRDTPNKAYNYITRFKKANSMLPCFFLA